MSEANFTSTNVIRVQLDSDVLRDLIHGDIVEREPRDEKMRAALERTCALREHQVYRLMRSMVQQLNSRLKGRRERFKLVEEGEGLILEFMA